MKKAKPAPVATRTVLIVLCNRLAPLAPVYHLELEVDPEGTILREKRLRARPKDARFDEVWVNDEGRKTFADCLNFKRVYRHALERKKT